LSLLVITKALGQRIEEKEKEGKEGDKGKDGNKY
jgi:hypothetical protein